ncbi:NACHT domain-containing protein [Actinacidiphila oryziradicis]|uniref:hypothetical protein n=1 Tax=Actinacidiphila oryziradicis TaxID=2571141 RepID=UPI00145FD1CE|nr:hypothetical protein [Actinacidiphila oryziradicis]
MAELGPAGPDGANRDLKDRLKAALARQGLSQADIVRQTQLNGESVSKAAVSNALNPEKGPLVAFTLGAILNAAGISGTERDELFRLRDRAESHGTTQLEAYLEAAEKAARQHPYPGSLRAPSLPALADVYVRQQARTPAADNQDSPSPGNATTSGNLAGPAVPAAEVFRADHDICVLLGGPGGGKSTLLRAHLADSADGGLGSTTGKTIPVMVSAAALTGEDLLPTALAKTVTGDLRQFGLLDELGTDFFRHLPRAGVSWLVLVNGLDEIPDAAARSKVLTAFVNAASAGTGLYRSSPEASPAARSVPGPWANGSANSASGSHRPARPLCSSLPPSCPQQSSPAPSASTSPSPSNGNEPPPETGPPTQPRSAAGTRKPDPSRCQTPLTCCFS